MRLIHVALGSCLAACSFDSTGLDATSAAPTTGAGPAGGMDSGTEGGTDGDVTTVEAPTSEPESTDTTVGVSDTDPAQPTGSTTTDEPTGTTTSGPPPACGDGTVDPGETCDDGNLADDDGCTAQCQPATCGDGLVYVGMEECDDGDGDELLCTDQCLLPRCDDGARNGDEVDVDCGGACPECATGQLCGDDDDCAGNCAGGVCVEFASCLDLKQSRPDAPSDVYMIDPDQGEKEAPFAVYCEQEHDGGGWTMVLKVDGRTDNFVYGAARWTDNNTFNPDPALDRVETKLRSFTTVPLTELLVGIEVPIAGGGPLDLEYLELPAAAANARALFLPGTLIASDLGRPAWKGWISDSSLQAHCNREGINVQATAPAPQDYARVRIGIIGNENGANDCSSPNSYIGVGGGGTGVCVPDAVTTTGNRAGCGGDKGERDLPGFAVVFVR